MATEPGSALSIAADNETAASVSALWDEFSPLEHEPSMRALGYPPHFTFAVCPGLEAGVLWAAVAPALTGLRPVTVRFAEICAFDGAQPVLWAKPDETSSIRRLYDRIHALLEPARCAVHYRPDQWVAHCTLATAVRPECREAALALCGALPEPVEVRFDRFDCVAFPPVRVTRSLPLQSQEGV